MREGFYRFLFSIYELEIFLGLFPQAKRKSIRPVVKSKSAAQGFDEEIELLPPYRLKGSTIIVEVTNYA